MGKLFKTGLMETLDKHKDQIDYTLHSEFVGPASIEEVNRADDKHASFNDVDIVTGIVNSRTVAEASVSFKKSTYYQFANLGEHLSEKKQIVDNVSVESGDLWKDTYALTNYAYTAISKNGAYAASFYDTGYAFAQMVDVALKDNGKKDFLPVLVSQMPPPGQTSNVEEVVDRIERLMPDWVLAAFCGSEALRFLNAWKKRGLHKKIKLLGLSFLAEKLLELDSNEIEIVSVIDASADTIDIVEFNKKQFQDLGSKAARGILAKQNIDVLAQESQHKRFIVVCKKESSSHLKMVQKQTAKQVKMNNKYIKEILKQPTSAWQNPYMCI